MSTTLREVRVSKLLTLKKLAEESNLAVSTIWLIESGRTVPRLSTVERLCKVLGVTPPQVVEFDKAVRSFARGAHVRYSAQQEQTGSGLHTASRTWTPN